jgi:hypothetical protein
VIWLLFVVVCRFPDRVVLQGYFHPRHSMADVYQWVHASIVQMGDVVSADNISPVDYSLFELYVSPPRTVLPPFTSSSSKSDISSSSSSTGPTLTDLRLVPAALIHLSWSEAHSSVVTMRAAEILPSSGVKGSGGGPIGRYLTESLLAQSINRASDSATNSESGVYPIGATLVPAAKTESGSNNWGGSSGEKKAQGSVFSGSGNVLGGGGGEEKKASGKPKWFKM